MIKSTDYKIGDRVIIVRLRTGWEQIRFKEHLGKVCVVDGLLEDEGCGKRITVCGGVPFFYSEIELFKPLKIDFRDLLSKNKTLSKYVNRKSLTSKK